jgi:hypothetical protein
MMSLLPQQASFGGDLKRATLPRPKPNPSDILLGNNFPSHKLAIDIFCSDTVCDLVRVTINARQYL